MRNVLLLLVLLTLGSSAEYYKSDTQRLKEEADSQKTLCTMFTKKALEYQQEMRDDELALITLASYKKRAKIYCSDGKFKIEKVVTRKAEEPKEVIKDIELEDERLCKIFQDKVKKYKQNMRNDELAYVTLASYEKRAYIFCSEEPLEKKEKGVRQEDKQLCKVFQQGPKICHQFDTIVIKDTKNTLSRITKKSFEKRANVFCSTKPLHVKDKTVYEENKQLCQLYYDNIKIFQKNMKENPEAKKTLFALKKRVDYFCSKK